MWGAQHPEKKKEGHASNVACWHQTDMPMQPATKGRTDMQW